MKQILHKLISTSAVSLLAFSGIAQGASEYKAEHIQGVAKASDIIGMTVKNNQDETIGKVDELALDLESGRIVAVILSSGGFLGLGQDQSVVPPSAFRFYTDRDTLLLDVTKDMLSLMPQYNDDLWSNLGQPEYLGEIYRAYQVEPYFTDNPSTSGDHTARINQGDSKADVNNSAQNVRDRDDATMTPFDQGNSKADTDTTAQIRREINAAENTSLSGRNVKIITTDGRVTLRGPVNSAEEKRLIGEIATRIARSGNVDNQLEVKATTSSN